MEPRLSLQASDWREEVPKGQVGRVTVQVATKDRPRELYGFLCSLLAQDYMDWDLIIVDDSIRPCWTHKNDCVRKLLEVMARNGHNITCFQVRERGIDRSYDIALYHTHSELGLREEDDHALENGYLSELVRIYDAITREAPEDMVRKGVAAIAGLSLNPYEEKFTGSVSRNPVAMRAYFYYERGEHGRCALIPNDDQRSLIISDKVYCVPILHGMWLFNVEALRSIGGFATITNGFRGETATTLRLWWEGYSLWVAPNAVAYHIPGKPAKNSHRGLGGKNVRAKCEEVFQEWLQDSAERGRPIPIDLQWERLPQSSS